MNLENAKKSLIGIINSLEEGDRRAFYSWLQQQICSNSDTTKATSYLHAIAEDIKTLIPLEAIFPSERIFDFESNRGAAPSIHLDSFLFDDNDVDTLVDEGRINRNYCKNCHSFDIAPVTFLSHSASIERIIFIFEHMLPNLENKCFLDVGSRLGAILYGAYYCSAARKIIGVEMNEDMCNLQKHVIDKYRMQDRIEIICNNVCNIPDVVKEADVIAFNNAFECFMSKEDQARTWLWLKNHITRPGTFLVTVPSMEEVLGKLKTEIDISSWLRRKPINNMMAQLKDEDLMSEICLYVVI